jgi:hypothetical protein
MSGMEIEAVRNNLEKVTQFVANLCSRGNKELNEKVADAYDELIVPLSQFYHEQIGKDKFSYTCQMFGPGTFTFENNETYRGHLLTIVYGPEGVDPNDKMNTFRHVFVLEMIGDQVTNFKEIKIRKDTLH